MPCSTACATPSSSARRSASVQSGWGVRAGSIRTQDALGWASSSSSCRSTRDDRLAGGDAPLPGRPAQVGDAGVEVVARSSASGPPAPAPPRAGVTVCRWARFRNITWGPSSGSTAHSAMAQRRTACSFSISPSRAPVGHPVDVGQRRRRRARAPARPGRPAVASRAGWPRGWDRAAGRRSAGRRSASPRWGRPRSRRCQYSSARPASVARPSRRRSSLAAMVCRSLHLTRQRASAAPRSPISQCHHPDRPAAEQPAPRRRSAARAGRP